jgi:hypothetical protein
MERNETIYETAKFFKDRKDSVHITLTTGKWFNGIIEFLPETKDRLVLKEEKFGIMLILFERIADDGIVKREVRV